MNPKIIGAFPSIYNSFTPASIKIQESEIMITVLKDILLNGKERILLDGPSSVGKSTCLLWLYKKLMKCGWKVLCIRPDQLQGNVENLNFYDINVLMMDLHNFCAVPNLSMDSMLTVCRTSSIRCIFATTSSLASISVAQHRNHSKQFQAIRKCFTTYVMKPLPNNKALELARQFHSANPEFQKFVTDKACGLPGHITLKAENEHDYVVAQSQIMKREWEIFIRNINESFPDIKDSLLLLSAFENKLPYTIYGFDDITVIQQALVMDHILYVDTTKKCVYSYYKDLRGFKRMLRYNQYMFPHHQGGGGVSDNETCLGLCFEFEAVPTLCKLNIVFCPIQSGTNKYTVDLNLRTCHNSRYDLKNETLLHSVLYLLTKRTKVIDYIAIKTIDDTKFVILIQISIQKDGNLCKCEDSFKCIPKKLFQVHEEGEQPPTNVIYIYVNPVVDFKFDEGLTTTKNVIEGSHSSLAKSGRNFYFAMPTEESLYELNSVFRNLKESMDPSVSYARV